ncbi:hypothetical protein DND132_2418 [Pseudodesulfovibrio mercurii]|uniref:DUF3861 family protein n=1 Tax=Pseudodesulfovibrio mercurii TaxID=641491 RepID=F0JC48_9BACT|nr:DUF3861 domain-containing protein [Pseudodesulfovibrio mercurii]EGB15621.1 hypothetical protein DND132_2418 [Pseudodesulfovibrio mercurii]
MPEHRYRITVEPLSDEAPPLAFETACHDDLAVVMGRIEARTGLPPDRARALGLGLKLFGEALLRMRETPPFDDLAPHFGRFMQALKKHPA